MKKLLFLASILMLTSEILNAQSGKHWKHQIYAGYTKNLRTATTPVSSTGDLSYASKQNWLFNVGFTHAKYAAQLQASPGYGIPLSVRPSVTVHQFHFAAGRRFDLLPKWSISLLAGPSYTKFKYPVDLLQQQIKTGVIVPITYRITAGQMETKTSPGIHVSGELNFYLCENLEMHVGYMYDFNKVRRMGGFEMGTRVGVMKQKYGTQRPRNSISF